MTANTISRIIVRVSRWSSTGNPPRPAREAPSIATDAPGIAQTQRQRRSFKPDHPIRRPQSQGPRSQTTIVRPPCHDQIAIARGAAPSSTPAGSFPGGFRTTAPASTLVAASPMGRHLKPFTQADI
jgi:hypothetical protein